VVDKTVMCIEIQKIKIIAMRRKSNITSSVAIFQHYQCMEFTFHNSYVILELVPSTVILWTELSCWPKSYSSKATLLLGWSHHYTSSTVVITIWLTVTKYLKWQWIFYFLRRSLYHCQYFCRWESYKKQELLTLREHMSSSPVYFYFFGRGVRVAYFVSFLCCPIMCLYVLSYLL